MNKQTDMVIVEAQRIDNEIWRAYEPDSEEIDWEEAHYRVIPALEADIETILLYRPDLEDLVMKKINESPCSAELLGLLNIEKIKRAVAIRKDWETALRNSKTGSDLSSKIRWSFYDEDIRRLAKLHKKGKFREKIENLLEDCNFHKECGDFMEGDYDEYL